MVRLLHPALRLLWHLQLKAGWRKMTRSSRTAKGILRLVLTAGLLVIMFGPLIALSTLREEPDPAVARSILEPGILLFTLLIVIGNGPNGGMFFTPPEVDFLFPGPFRRQELILYRLGHQVPAALFLALFVSVAPAAFVPHWVFAFFGIALALQFIQLISTVLSLTISLIGQTAYTRARRVALAILGAVVLGGIVQAGVASGGLADLTQFPQTPIGRAVLLPFQPLSRTIAAERLFPDFLGWAAAAMSLNVALILLTLRLDSDFYERSIAVSEKVSRALEHAKRGQAFMGFSKPVAGKWRLPMPARLRGAGPIAWRHCVSALRSSRAVIYAVLFFGAALALTAYFLRDSGSGMVITALVMFGLFTFPQMLQFDFRGDIERIDLLKTLPASSGAIVVGELIVPVLLATLIEWMLALSTGFLWTDWTTVLAICAWLPAANLIIFALENLLFLYYPRRPANKGTTFQASGQQMVVNFIKVVVLAVLAGVAATFGAVAFLIFGRSMMVGLVTAWCVSAVLGAVLVPLVARAFRVLDPSLETTE